MSLPLFFPLLILFSSLLPASPLPCSFPSPTIIAHRGSCGSQPEETIAAYELAVLQNANYLECDTVLTRDGYPICRHEPNLNISTDISNYPQYKNRTKTYIIDNNPSETGLFSIDFSLNEIKQLHSKQMFPFRDTSFNQYGVATTEEFFCVAMRTNLWREYVYFISAQNLLINYNQTELPLLNSILKSSLGDMKMLTKVVDCFYDVDEKNVDEVQQLHDDLIVLRTLYKTKRSIFAYNWTLHPWNVFRIFKPKYLKKFNLFEFKNLVDIFLLLPDTVESNKFVIHRQIEFTSKFVDVYRHFFGIYVETKHSAWHLNQLNYNIVDKLYNKIDEFGLNHVGNLLIFESFDAFDIKYIKSKSDVCSVQLMFKNDNNNIGVIIEGRREVGDGREADSEEEVEYVYPKMYYEEGGVETVVVKDARQIDPNSFHAAYFESQVNDVTQLMDTKIVELVMKDVKKFADGVGPDKTIIVPLNAVTNRNEKPTKFVEAAHKEGLIVHPYTFRSEFMFLSYTYISDPYKEYELFLKDLKVDGIFTDFAGSGVNYMTFAFGS